MSHPELDRWLRHEVPTRRRAPVWEGCAVLALLLAAVGTVVGSSGAATLAFMLCGLTAWQAGWQAVRRHPGGD